MGIIKTISLFLLLGQVAAITLVSCNNNEVSTETAVNTEKESNTEYTLGRSRGYYVEQKHQKERFHEALEQFEKEHAYRRLPVVNCKYITKDSLGCMRTKADFKFNSWLSSSLCVITSKAPSAIDTTTIVMGESYFFKGTEDLGQKMYYRFTVTRWQFENVKSSNAAFELGNYLFTRCDKITSHHFLFGTNWYVFQAGGNYAYEETGKAMEYFKERIDKKI